MSIASDPPVSGASAATESSNLLAGLRFRRTRTASRNRCRSHVLALGVLVACLTRTPVAAAHDGATVAGLTRWHGVALALAGVGLIGGSVVLKRRGRLRPTRALPAAPSSTSSGSLNTTSDGATGPIAGTFEAAGTSRRSAQVTGRSTDDRDLMGREPAEPERRPGRTGEIGRLRETVERLEGQIEAMDRTGRWKPMRSECTHCHRGHLVRDGMTVRCRACGYQSG